MKTKITQLTLFFLSITMIVNAQPLPPTTPSGSPVPVEWLLALLPIAMSILGILKLRKRKFH